jgi:hypothetical protein
VAIGNRNSRFRLAYSRLWIVPLLGLSACQSAPHVRSPPQAPAMPECFQQIPQEDLLKSLIQATRSFETGSSTMPVAPAMGAEQMRQCLITAKKAWPK